MDPTQTPRAVVDSNAPRPLSMQVKQNRILPSGFHARPPGPPPGSPRYPIHNGAAGGPRLGGRPPPELQRLDSRSTLSSPAGQPNQFVQQRPSFPPPRSQISPVGNTSPGNYPRALLPPAHPANPSNQLPIRYSNSSPSPNIRGPYPPPGQRPPFNPQQFLRPQRSASFETGGGVPPHARFGAYPQITDNRPVTPRIIPENITTGLKNNGSTLKTTKTMAAIEEQNTQKIPQVRPEPLEKMESNEPKSTLDVNDEEHERSGRKETPKPRTTSQNSIRDDDENNDNDNDSDDDDVIMDMEKESTSSVDIQPVTPTIPDLPKSPTVLSRTDVKSLHEERSNARMSIDNSPVTATIPDLPKSPTVLSRTDVKSSHEERSNSKMSIDNSPVTNNQDIPTEQPAQSAIKKEANASDTKTPVMEEGDNTMVDTKDVVNNISRPSSNSAARTPSPNLTGASPDMLATSPIPASLTPSPDPTTGVMGYDNGKLRSLSPKSNKSLSPAPPTPRTPTSPKIPGTPIETVDEEDIASLSENSSPTDNKESVMEQSADATLAVTEKFDPPRAPTPMDPPRKQSSTFRHSIESGDGEGNGTNPTVQATQLTTNGVAVSPTKKSPIKLRESDKLKPAGSPVKSPTKSIKSLPRTPESGPLASVEKKKVPMNKVQVGAAPSPNLKTVRSKIGSLDNTSYRPGGGKVKIENRKLDFSKAQPKIAAKNDKYAPSGGDKKITQVKLQWNAKPKVGSLDNATYKPGGGDKKIETVKLDFKDKAKPKVGSKDNAKHVPGGGTVKSTVTPPKTPQELLNDIETQKIDIKAESKVGSMDNMKHKPGGGDKKIFNDRDYLRQTSSNVESVNGSGAQDNVNELNELKKPNPNPPPSTPTRTRTPTSSHLQSPVTSPITARAVRTGLQAKSPDVSKELTITTEQTPQNSGNDVKLNTNSEISVQTARSPSPKTPTTSRPPSSISLKSQDKSSSSNSSRKTSPKGFHLPKLTNTMSFEDTGSQKHNQESTAIKLPKLIETST